MSSGLNGIGNKTEPPPMFEGDVYSADDPPEVPKSLQDDRLPNTHLLQTLVVVRSCCEFR